MSGLAEMRRLEQWMTYVRWFGVLFGTLSIATQPRFSSEGTRTLGWATLALLAIGSVAIWGAIARIHSEKGQRNLSGIAFVFDCLIIMGIVSVFAHEELYVSWALLFLIPMEGALRYRLRGALIGALVVALFFIPHTMRRSDFVGEPFDASTYIFVVGLATLVAGITGNMAENWYTQAVAFERQTARLAESDRLKDRFLAITSHEIRGPLTAIITGTDTVWRRWERMSPEQRGRVLEMVSLQSHQLARLVDDLMVSSQLQSHGLALQPEWADLAGTVNQALEAAAGKRRDHQLEVFVEPLRCEIDANRVGQIIRNLVENAYKYTPDRTRVAVAAKAVEDGIDISIADEGPGVPADKRDQLFEAFARIEETAAGQEGVGLGLFVVSQLVAAMNGRIDLASSSRGTTFNIHVPCKRQSAEKPILGLIHRDRGATG
jgi:signal transduction histidine kinase